jgi:hypothetical protein
MPYARIRPNSPAMVHKARTTPHMDGARQRRASGPQSPSGEQHAVRTAHDRLPPRRSPRAPKMNRPISGRRGAAPMHGRRALKRSMASSRVSTSAGRRGQSGCRAQRTSPGFTRARVPPPVPPWPAARRIISALLTLGSPLHRHLLPGGSGGPARCSPTRPWPRWPRKTCVECPRAPMCRGSARA